MSASLGRASAASCFISHCLTSCLSPGLDQNGSVQCEAISCPPPQCPAGTAPAYVKGACCKECQREWSTLDPPSPSYTRRIAAQLARKRAGRPTTSTSARFGRSSAQGLPDHRPGLCCVAKLPPHTPPETVPTFCIYMDPLIIQNRAPRRRWPPDTQSSPGGCVIAASDVRQQICEVWEEK